MMYSMMKPVAPMFSDPFFRDFFGAPQHRQPQHPGMHMRIHETDAAYLLESDLPGVGRDNITLSVDGNVLTIAAVRPAPQWAAADEDGNKPRREHRMERSFEMEGIDTAAIAADYVDGVLKVTLPKEQPAEKPAPRQIAIGGEAQAALTE